MAGESRPLCRVREPTLGWRRRRLRRAGTAGAKDAVLTRGYLRGAHARLWISAYFGGGPTLVTTSDPFRITVTGVHGAGALRVAKVVSDTRACRLLVARPVPAGLARRQDGRCGAGVGGSRADAWWARTDAAQAAVLEGQDPSHIVNADGLVYVYLVHGDFTRWICSLPAGASAPEYRWLFALIDARSHIADVVGNSEKPFDTNGLSVQPVALPAQRAAVEPAPWRAAVAKQSTTQRLPPAGKHRSTVTRAPRSHAMLCSLATKLDQGQIEEIESLAKDLGTPILAFACHQTDAAPIDDAQIGRHQGARGQARRRAGRRQAVGPSGPAPCRRPSARPSP